MNSLSNDVKQLLKEKKYSAASRTVDGCVKMCEDRAKQQMLSYLQLVLNRLTENETINKEICTQEEAVANFLHLIHQNRHQQPFFNDFEDLL